MPEIVLDADHRYHVDGRQVPGVTSILAETGLAEDYLDVPDEMLAAAAARGTAAHLATQLDDEGRLDEATVDEAIRPYLVAWRAFRAATKFTPERIETRLYRADCGYAGTADRIGRVTGPAGVERRVLLDLKTTARLPRHVGPQTAAYAWAALDDPSIGAIDARWAVHLQRAARPDGPPRFRVVNLDDPEDYRVWFAAITIYRWRHAYDR